MDTIKPLLPPLPLPPRPEDGTATLKPAMARLAPTYRCRKRWAGGQAWNDNA